MTDIEIDKALALAIGHRASEMYTDRQGNLCLPEMGCWRVFSHCDWNVIGPIAERYDCFPQKGSDIFGGEYWWACTDDLGEAHADTPQRAIALAVIGAKK